MDIEAIKSAYRRYARFYDAVFGPIFHPGRKHIIDALNCRSGDSVLEVGVGTGLSFPMYPGDVRLTGIDISTEMLDKARQRVTEHGLSNVDAVLEMDAEAMAFADDSFDKVIAMYVVSVVPDPARLVDEMRRVCKPDGEIIIVNHFRSEHPVVRTSEGLLSPLSKLAGFRPDMDLEDFLASTQLEVEEIRKVNLFGYWKVLRCRNVTKEPMVA